MTYKVIYRELNEYVDYIDADSEDEAMDKWQDKIDEGRVDFSDMEIVTSKVRCVLENEESL